jgi:hypothetical protein
MPRFFCDYCDAYLTHDSAPGRQQHIRGHPDKTANLETSTFDIGNMFDFLSFINMTGWKHRENFKAYYQTFAQQWEQEQQAKEMQHQMQMMQDMQGGGMMPPLDHFQQQQQSTFGGPVPQFPPPHLMGQQQQFPPQLLMGMPPPQPNMHGHPQISGAPHPQFRQPPTFQPPPLFPQQMQLAANPIQSDSNNSGHEIVSTTTNQQ